MEARGEAEEAGTQGQQEEEAMRDCHFGGVANVSQIFGMWEQRLPGRDLEADGFLLDLVESRVQSWQSSICLERPVLLGNRANSRLLYLEVNVVMMKIFLHVTTFIELYFGVDILDGLLNEIY
jgi:hypothetical protein